MLFRSIVVGFEAIDTGDVISIYCGSVNAGHIPTRPAPQSENAAQNDCQYYYWKTFEKGVVPATAAGINTGAVLFPGIGVDIVGSQDFSVEMRATPNMVSYNPVNNTAQFYVVNTASDGISAAFEQTDSTGYGISGNCSTSFPGGAFRCYIHVTADARLGIV